MIEDRMFPVLENLLSWTSKRQQALSANIANMDTPGFRAKDVSFSDELGSNLEMTTTASQHIALEAESANTRVFEVGTKEKDNGNSVDLDRELTELTKNGLQYITLVQYLNQRIKTLRSAITEGGKA